MKLFRVKQIKNFKGNPNTSDPYYISGQDRQYTKIGPCKSLLTNKCSSGYSNRDAKFNDYVIEEYDLVLKKTYTYDGKKQKEIK